MGGFYVEIITRNGNCQITYRNIYWLLASIKYITKFAPVIRIMQAGI